MTGEGEVTGPVAVIDSRRLPGISLLWDRPGAIADVTIEGDADRFLRFWREEARRLLDALGWRAESVTHRAFPGGASLAISAPLDGMLSATEINEWAIAAATARFTGGRPLALEPAASELALHISAERRPALIALARVARELGVTCLIDPDEVSVGTGTGAITWPIDAIPDPADVPWTRVHDVPSILVTGSNGKTTTVRLLAAVARAAGRVPGYCCTDGVTIGDRPVEAGDWAGPGGARRVLRDRQVEIAILETARGGILRRGLAGNRADAAIVTNVAEDHFGEFGVFDLRSLLEAKLVVARAVGPGGRVVLNADDPELVAASDRVAAPISWITLQRDHPVVRRHMTRGGDACFVDGQDLVRVSAGLQTRVATLDEIPITLGGAARHNVANALGVVALAGAVGYSTETIARGLRDFRGDPAGNPGRLNHFEFGGLQVLIDFAHNPHGMDALVATASALPASRRLIIIGQAGDRDDAAIQAFARSAWRFRPDRIVLKEMEHYLRGRPPGEISDVLAAEFRRLGAGPDTIVRSGSEIEAVRQALRWGRPGDLLLLPTHAERAAVLALIARLQERGWRPGEAIE